MKYILWGWQFIQNLLGMAFWSILCGEKPVATVGDINIYKARMGGGISLGNKIFLGHAFFDLPIDDLKSYIKHELGHTVQSKRLGIFYLFIIGIPSLLWATFYTYAKPVGVSYRSFYTEVWADYYGNKIDLSELSL
jgi:hypothetical protein